VQRFCTLAYCKRGGGKRPNVRRLLNTSTRGIYKVSGLYGVFRASICSADMSMSKFPEKGDRWTYFHVMTTMEGHWAILALERPILVIVCSDLPMSASPSSSRRCCHGSFGSRLLARGLGLFLRCHLVIATRTVTIAHARRDFRRRAGAVR
jgi:hypothetical protein